jgi:hypothetical protein
VISVQESTGWKFSCPCAVWTNRSRISMPAHDVYKMAMTHFKNVDVSN